MILARDHPSYETVLRVAMVDRRYAVYLQPEDQANLPPIALAPEPFNLLVPCIHLGDELTGLERQAADLDHRRNWHHCNHPQQPLGPHVCGCKGCGPHCSGYSDGSTPPDGIRHLAFHVYPATRQGGIVWRLAVDQLRLRWPLFTGRKVVAICTGDGLDSPETVRAYLPPDAITVTVPNNPSLREVATWLPLWQEILPHARPQDFALYCHAKGVTRNLDPGNSTHWWASLAWSLTLDHWPLVAEKLKRRPIVGPFKKVGYGFGHGFGRWHYSGTYFWANVGDFQKRLVTAVPAMWWGVEAWPGLAYDPTEADFLFMDGHVPSLDLYRPSFWVNTVRPRYAEWLQQNRPSWPWITAPSLSAGA